MIGTTEIAGPSPYGRGRGRPTSKQLPEPIDAAQEPEETGRAPVSGFESTNFDDNAVNNGGFLFIPPDSHAAAGLDHLVNVTNTTLRVHDKSGGEPLLDTSLQSFYAALGPVNALFDPKVVYDQYEDRFFVVALEQQDANAGDPENSSRILVAVSDDGNPLGTWFQAAINSELVIGPSETWADFPGLGLDEQAVYITSNQFAFSNQPSANTLRGVRVWILDKGTGAGFYAGGGLSLSVFDQNAGFGTSFDITNQPAHVIGTAPAGVGTWLTSYSGLNNAVDSFLQVIRIDDPLGTPAFDQSFVNIGGIENFGVAMPDAPQPGTPTDLDTGDRRTLEAVWRDNDLWTVFNVVGNTAPDTGQVTAAWARLTASGAGAAPGDEGVIGGESLAAGTHTFFPSIAVDSAGKAVIGFSASANTLFGGAYYATRAAADPAGATNAPIVVRAGVDDYIRTFGGSRNRWGDYSATVLDPATECFWIYNQYAMTGGTPIGGEDGRWATAFEEECPPEDTSDAPASYGVARHVPDASLLLGATVDIEAPRFTSSDALGDDNEGSSDEDGLSGFSSGIFAVGDTFEVTLATTNTTGSSALLCGWIDFNDDGDFDNADSQAQTVDAERECATIVNTQASATLSFRIPNDFVSDGGADSRFFSRFRITSDWANAAASDPVTAASDGEVEDHAIDLATLSVSLHAFESNARGSSLNVRWSSISETRNLGYRLWVDRGRGLEPVGEAIGATSGDVSQARDYAVEIDGQGVTALMLETIDLRGLRRSFGPFEIGRRYGRDTEPTAAIDWPAIARADHARSDDARGIPAQATALDVLVRQNGMHEISWQTLADHGLDWTGVPLDQISVTLKGQPVARHIVTTGEITGGSRASFKQTRAQTFGPGMSIRFWGRTPEFPDARYVGGYVYRLAVNSTLARPARALQAEAKPGAGFYMREQIHDADTGYHFSNPLPDPWYLARLRADTTNSHEVEFNIDSDLIGSRPARLSVMLGGLTDFPESPDHEVELVVNGEVVRRLQFEGNSAFEATAELPPGILRTGANTVGVVASGGTQAAFDVFLVDRIALRYPSHLLAADDRLLLRDPDPAGGLTVSGFSTTDTVAYALDEQGSLAILPRVQFSRGTVRVPQLESERAEYWISSRDRIRQPEIHAVVGPNPLAGAPAGDLVVIAHPQFMPEPGDLAHPLARWRAARSARGWTVSLFDLDQIQRHYGHGMPLPGAVTQFLEALRRDHAFDHVLLVGGDSYDYHDTLALGSTSHIPTRYAPTRFITHAPSDALMGDLDHDGRPDLAIGRWPVRTLGDLNAIVQKTLDWPSGTAGLESSAWVVDSEDPDQPSFASQADRMIDQLMGAGWQPESLNRIDFDEVVPDSGQTRAEAARGALFDAIEAGSTLTGFIGHGAPSMWTFQGLLVPDDLGQLLNEGRPTLISTLTCYTTYFASPIADGVAHRWINGYRTSADGTRIEGVANGAVAVHGASTLSSYAHNETFAREVHQQLLAGATLGMAIESARRSAADQGRNDVVVTWTLLGDPTLRLADPDGQGKQSE